MKISALSIELNNIFIIRSKVDDILGRIISKLTERGIRNDTLIVFMSDNGPVSKVRNDKFIKNFKFG